MTAFNFSTRFSLEKSYSRPCAVPLIEERGLHTANKNAQGQSLFSEFGLWIFWLGIHRTSKRTLDQSSRHIQFCLLSSFTMGCSQSKSHPAAVVAPEKRTGETSSFKPGDSSRAATVDEKPKPLVFAIMRNGHVSCQQDTRRSHE